MGIPALFRWLSNKYPKIISPVIEEQPYEINGEVIPVDTTKPNPNGEEFDNLYLDMNGIVHPCTHPEGRPPPENEEEMMLEIFKYTDRVVNMVRPRKLLMIAVDGVAPRAKMNQQRSRRFRSAQEAKEADQKKEEFQKMLAKKNGDSSAPTSVENVIKKTWDSNVITPGTPFMDILATSLRYWVAYKLNTDPAWEKLKVIISDSTVPGEGEHKIMEFIRSQRASPEHDPNTRHVLYGLDADLIMLGLATHEPHFRVLREDVFFQESKPRTCQLCGQVGHKAEECRGQAKEKSGQFDEKQKTPALKPFIWLHVSILREYLAAEMQVPNQPFPFDLERALDDWIFMCFFVGNDFLPHLPSLDIRENGIDTLISIWRDCVPYMDSYVTKDGRVNFKHVQLILSGLAKQEDAIFRRRRQAEERKLANEKRRKEEEKMRNEERARKRRRSSPSYAPFESGPPPTKTRKLGGDLAAPTAVDLITPSRGNLSRETRELTHSLVVNRGNVYKANMANKSAAAVLKSQLLKGGQGSNSSNGVPDESATHETAEPTTPLSKRPLDEDEDDVDDDDAEPGTPGRDTPVASKDVDELPPDTVRLWEEGYADRYYEQKFRVDPKDLEFRRKVARSYAEGLQWVLLYYFQGCPSWTWYYPYHYAPFAADFVDIADMEVHFEKGKPFLPFEQLMGVLPASSNHALPKIFHDLMVSPDSEIIDFYPEEFEVDLNGKKFAWQGVVLLPFIDEKRLLAAMEKRYPLLTEEEKARNTVGKDVLFISDRHPLYEHITAAFYSKKQGVSKLHLNMRISNGLAGRVERNELYVPHGFLAPPFDNGKMPTLDEDRSLMVNYEIPKSPHVHKSMILRGVKFAPPALSQTEINIVKAKARNNGRSYGGAPLQNGKGNGPIHYGPSSKPSFADRPNPFAAHLDPSFIPPPGWGPPPPGAGYSRGPPPPPSRGSYYQPPYQGPPPPPQPSGYHPPGSGYGHSTYGSYGQGSQPPRYNQPQPDYYRPSGSSGYSSYSGGNQRGGHYGHGRDSYPPRRNTGYGRY